MTLLDRLGDRMPYLDANAFIYGVEDVEPYAARVHDLLAAILSGTRPAVTSEITLAECLVGPFRDANPVGERAFYEALRPRPGGLTVVPVSRAVLVEAARLRATSRLKLPDAVHVATARLSGCDVLLTNDAGLASAAGVEVLRLADAL